MKIDVEMPEELRARLERIESQLGPRQPPYPEFLTLWQYAEIKGVTPRTVQRWAQLGKIKVQTIKHGRVIHRDNLNLT